MFIFLFFWCYFRVCGRERNPGQTSDFPSGGETLAGYSKDVSDQHVRGRSQQDQPELYTHTQDQ